MFESPVTTRQKVTENPRFSHIFNELNALVNLRKNTGELIEEVCLEESRLLLKRLERIEVEVSKIKTLGSSLPEMTSIIKCFRTLSKEFDESNQNLCEDIVLLKIIDQKKNCLIAKIIDEI